MPYMACTCATYLRMLSTYFPRASVTLRCLVRAPYIDSGWLFEKCASRANHIFSSMYADFLSCVLSFGRERSGARDPQKFIGKKKLTTEFFSNFAVRYTYPHCTAKGQILSTTCYSLAQTVASRSLRFVAAVSTALRTDSCC